MDQRPRELYETGSEPEFVIHDIPKWEDAGDGLIRIYVSSMRGKTDKIEYSFVCAPDTLARLGRAAMVIASEFHNLYLFRVKTDH